MPRDKRIPFQPAAPGVQASTEVAPESYRVEKDAAGKETLAPAGPLPLGEWVTAPFEGLPWNIEAKVGRVNGVVQLVGLKIEATGGVVDLTADPPVQEFEPGPQDIDPTITASLLRQLPLRQLRQMATNLSTESFELERPPGGWTDEHYQAVARVYTTAPRAPRLAIAERWNVSPAAASKWITEARLRGLLAWPTRPGVAGASAAQSPVQTKQKKNKKGRNKR